MSETDVKTEKNKCRFMSIEECRQLKVGVENLEICRLCILGRIEGHLFDLKAYVGKMVKRKDYSKDKHKHWSDRNKKDQ